MSTLSLWLDDVRPAPPGWVHARSVNEAISIVKHHTGHGWLEASLDHDLGDYEHDGGDGFRFVLWMAEHNRWPIYPPAVHSVNPVGRIRMEKDIEHYWDTAV